MNSQSLDISTDLISKLRSHATVGGLTHDFYCYPARFAPEFVRETILEFSEQGDCVLDLFMGGGTTIVEAIANGRTAIGIDINSLAHFITTVKTTPLSDEDGEAILSWVESVTSDESNILREISTSDLRMKNVPNDVVPFIVEAASKINQLQFPRQRRFARAVLLRLGQWALNCRDDKPSTVAMKLFLPKQARGMLSGLAELVDTTRKQGVAKNKITSKRLLHWGTIEDISPKYDNKCGIARPKLVITSPPYPGVHVLYHRWQVNGRRETPAPYWITDLLDGHGEGYYTLGGRSESGLKTYFSKLTSSYASLRTLLDPKALVIQLVAFSNPEQQLPDFLQAMTEAGYDELMVNGNGDARLSRQVPHRKWYAYKSANQSASNEVLLFHRLRP